MTATLKEKFDTLIKLQEIELEAISIGKAIKNIPVKLDALNASISGIRQVVEDATGRLEKLQKAYRDHESDAALQQTRIRKSKEKMSAVKTNKEYQSSLKEIEELETRFSDIEDRMIECLDEIDRAEALLKDKKEEFQRSVKELEEEKKEIRRQEEHEKQRLIEIARQKEEILGAVDPMLLKNYESVKKIVGDKAIAIGKNAVCQACNVNIPPQLFNVLQRFDDVHHCPFCQRILIAAAD